MERLLRTSNSGRLLVDEADSDYAVSFAPLMLQHRVDRTLRAAAGGTAVTETPVTPARSATPTCNQSSYQPENRPGRGKTMKAIVVADRAEGLAGMKLTERPEPQPAINDVVVAVHASGFVQTEIEWPSTWTD